MGARAPLGNFGHEDVREGEEEEKQMNEDRTTKQPVAKSRKLNSDQL